MRTLGRLLEHREIRHVLLHHIGHADVDAREGLLGAFEREGVRWVSLERALEVPFYRLDPDIADAEAMEADPSLHRPGLLRPRALTLAAPLDRRLRSMAKRRRQNWTPVSM
jgi:hypothetical protein